MIISEECGCECMCEINLGHYASQNYNTCNVFMSTDFGNRLVICLIMILTKYPLSMLTKFWTLSDIL